jgi:hypothetical protein
MNQSDIIKNLVNPTNSLFIGMTIIHRVFEYFLIKTNNIDNAYLYAQKACYYYLEYLEQINKSELAFSFNHLDIVLFVYNKTIFEGYNSDSNMVTSNKMTNVITLNKESLTISQQELQILFNHVLKFSKIIFVWDNQNISFGQRVIICNDLLLRYLNKIDHIDLISSYLEIIQEKVELTFPKYNEILVEIILLVEKMKKTKILNHYDKNGLCLHKFYIEKQAFHKKFQEEPTKELVKWLFV